MVSVKAEAPAIAESGSNDATSGARAAMVKASGTVWPPPGPAVKTVSCAFPGVARSAAGTVARSSPGETMDVARSAPFQRATESELFRKKIVLTNPLGAVIATRPAKRPLPDMEASGFPYRIHM